jgi:hypothetical protein
MDHDVERRALQSAVAVAALLPVTAGWLGILGGPQYLSLYGPAQSLSHAAYLSGLLLGIGLAFWSTIPDIEKEGRLFGLLCAIVMGGGLARAFVAIRLGVLSPGIAGPLLMELGVTPLLWMWQRRLEQDMRR